jgi:hypothetical protein
MTPRTKKTVIIALLMMSAMETSSETSVLVRRVICSSSPWDESFPSLMSGGPLSTCSRTQLTGDLARLDSESGVVVLAQGIRLSIRNSWRCYQRL